MKKRYFLLTERIGSAIRRSLRQQHACKVLKCIRKRGFRLAACLNFSDYYFRGSFDVFFPPKPYRSTRKHWDNFASWLKWGTGERFGRMCMPWVKVGIKHLKRCKECRAASKNRKGKKNRCRRGERFDEKYERDDVAMMKVLVGLIKKWPSPKLRKKKFLKGVEVKEVLEIKGEILEDDLCPGFGCILEREVEFGKQHLFEKGESSGNGAAREGAHVCGEAEIDAVAEIGGGSIGAKEDLCRGVIFATADNVLVDAMMLDPDVAAMTLSGN